jgi:hypothetical protein
LATIAKKNETTAIAMQQLRKYAAVLEELLDSGPHATMEVLLEAVFSMWFARSLYHSTDRVEFSTDRGLVYSAKSRISITRRMCDTYSRKRPSIFIGDKLILSAQMMLHKEYGCKGSAEKDISKCDPQGAWRQDE